MRIYELLMIAVGLSMDSFSVSVCKGTTVENVKIKHILLCGIFFGFFQAAMPVLGYYVGINLVQYVSKYDHWIALILLASIGISMIKESFEDKKITPDFSFKTMIILAIATSIDALSIGVNFALMDVNIWSSVLCIGITTFLFSAAGVLLGHKFGTLLGKRAELFGGIILICLGIKIVIEHLFF